MVASHFKRHIRAGVAAAAQAPRLAAALHAIRGAMERARMQPLLVCLSRPQHAAFDMPAPVHAACAHPAVGLAVGDATCELITQREAGERQVARNEGRRCQVCAVLLADPELAVYRLPLQKEARRNGVQCAAARGQLDFGAAAGGTGRQRSRVRHRLAHTARPGQAAPMPRISSTLTQQ